MTMKARTISDQEIFSVIARNPDSGSSIHDKVVSCGHEHKTLESAQACERKLTRQWCLCGRTNAATALCCGTPRTSTSDIWSGARIEVVRRSLATDTS
jgi:hypothetical protein